MYNRHYIRILGECLMKFEATVTLVDIPEEQVIQQDTDKAKKLFLKEFHTLAEHCTSIMLEAEDFLKDVGF